jgi:hypothetical protein
MAEYREYPYYVIEEEQPFIGYNVKSSNVILL